MKKTKVITLLFVVILSSVNLFSQSSSIVNGELVLNKDSLLKFLFKHNFQHYNVSPNIPKEFTEKKDKYEVPADETVMAYIDASVMGNGKFGIVIGLRGLYIFNSKTSHAPGRKALPYSTFKLAEVVRDNKDELGIGPVKIDILGLLKEDQNKAETFFKEMKSTLLK